VDPSCRTKKEDSKASLSILFKCFITTTDRQDVIPLEVIFQRNVSPLKPLAQGYVPSELEGKRRAVYKGMSCRVFKSGNSPERPPRKEIASYSVLNVVVHTLLHAILVFEPQQDFAWIKRLRRCAERQHKVKVGI